MISVSDYISNCKDRSLISVARFLVLARLSGVCLSTNNDYILRIGKLGTLLRKGRSTELIEIAELSHTAFENLSTTAGALETLSGCSSSSPYATTLA